MLGSWYGVSVALAFISVFGGVLWRFLSSLRSLRVCVAVLRGPGARSAVVVAI